MDLRTTRFTYLLEWVGAALLVVLFETDVFPQGIFDPESTVAYILQVIAALTTVVVVPVCHKMLSMEFIKHEIEAEGKKALVKWRILRNVPMGFTMMFDIFVYYTTICVSIGLCALIVAFVYILMWPKFKYESTEE